MRGNIVGKKVRNDCIRRGVVLFCFLTLFLIGCGKEDEKKKELASSGSAVESPVFRRSTMKVP